VEHEVAGLRLLHDLVDPRASSPAGGTPKARAEFPAGPAVAVLGVRHFDPNGARRVVRRKHRNRPWGRSLRGRALRSDVHRRRDSYTAA
jgi:hypothetical protein